MSETNFQPLFIYLDEQFKEVKEDIAEVRQGVGQLQTSVDIFAKDNKNLKEEMLVVNKRLEILET